MTRGISTQTLEWKSQKHYASSSTCRDASTSSSRSSEICSCGLRRRGKSCRRCSRSSSRRAKA
uniref:Uncharacterized protein n=1 Tax=Arundo donax TaxID=35708 RepID=A0A0A8YRM6_ARUDO